MLSELSEIFVRDLDRLRDEIKSFESEEDLWLRKEGISNSAGNLAMHITGNLQHFIGHVLGNSGYQRNRDAEFNSRVSRSVLLSEIDLTKSSVATTLQNLSSEDIQAEFPIQVIGRTMSTKFFLMHLSGHLNYHLGQINYYRRLK
jgi:uncharacterized damage-inducible protein DinB